MKSALRSSKKKRSYKRGLASAAISLILLTTHPTALFGAPPAPAALSAHSPQKIRFTNVRDTQFTVSWSTNIPCAGKINYGETQALGKAAYDDRGEKILRRLHHVTVRHLKPNTRYYFQIVSASRIFKNGKDPYACQTGPTIIPSKCDVAYGRLFQRLNIRHKIPYRREAVVYLTIVNKDAAGSAGESAVESAMLDKNGYWSCELANIREKGLARLFDYSNTEDALKIEVETGVYPTAAVTVDTGSDSPAQNIEIPQPKITKVKGR